jgi:Fe2+ or Zn2+ uptake regulation protein
MSEARRRGLRLTAQRLTVAKIVFENIESHPSFMEILEAAKRSVPGISASTVYNTLQLLEELGLVQSFSVAGVTRYDKPHPHINLVCLDTGKVRDAGDQNLISILEERIGAKKVRSVVVYAECGASEPG